MIQKARCLPIVLPNHNQKGIPARPAIKYLAYEAPTVSIPITSLTNHRERVFLNDSPAITRKIINKILTKSGFSAAYLRPSISGTFFSTLGIGSGTFHKAHAAKIGSKITIPIPMLAKISDIFPEVEKSWNIKIAANILLIESDSVIP